MAILLSGVINKQRAKNFTVRAISEHDKVFINASRYFLLKQGKMHKLLTLILHQGLE